MMPRRAFANGGFTLVELMVALVIGMFLTVVISSLFLGTRRSYAATEDIGRMQDNMRFTYEMLTRTVHLAGFRSAPNSVSSTIFAAPNVALSGAEGTGIASDTLTVRFQGSSDGAAAADGSVIDCTGQEVAAGVIATNTFTIATGADGLGALFCNGNRELVQDVQAMKILYGEDTSGDLIADRFVPFSGLANPDTVVSVRIALLFQTPTVQAALAPDTRTYDLNGTVLGPYNDMRVRRLLVLNVNLRNRTP